jgi:hypothetical protein
MTNTAIIDNSSDVATPAKILPHDNSRFFGLLSALEPHEDHQIATIDGHQVILPPDLDLSEYLNGPVGIACISGKFYVRRLDA